MFLGAGGRSKSSVRQKLVLKLAAALVNTTPSDGSVSAVKLAGSALGSGVTMINGTIVASVAGSALTVALKTLAGADPTASDPIYVVFRNTTPATGDYTVITITAATSVVVSSGSTLGTQNSTAFRIWIVGFNDAGTFRLAVINCINAPGVPNIYPLGQFPVASSTAEGGAGAADSVWTFYTGSAVTSKAYAVLGYMTWESGLATAGTWSAGPTRVELFKPWTPLPGALLSVVDNRTGTFASGTTQIPADNTTPQITEGDQYMTVTLTPTSAANALHIEALAQLTNSGGTTNRIIMALFQDAVANALATAAAQVLGTRVQQLSLTYAMLANLAVSTTLRIRAGGDGTGTTDFNGEGGATSFFNGTFTSYLRVREVMG